MYQRFAHKPTEIKAWQYLRSEEAKDIVQWLHDEGFADARASLLMGDGAQPYYVIIIPRRKETVMAKPGQWIVKEGGQFRALSDQIFRSQYEPVG